ncbi:glycosyltransferase [Stutzerimonas stutzeri]|uniref:Glycosyl transferase family 1 n=1 Tax=Stutzerimonas stutzeri TaxID=316 RepID=A0A2N8RFU5_STUST|nr:glycosyltransferase [Stutzerimonas stutzeri]MCQ4253833.1 glycosyltransferase [Stutzerimonas stutzeri]PNF59962.1 glycosyl transferase family 1 [Stutzerimonas stutzeri]
MKILFVHQNFPGQFKHLFTYCRNRGDDVAALGEKQTRATADAGAVRYELTRGNTPGIHPWAQEFESKVIRGEAAAQAAQRLKDTGFEPDVIFAHPGWGEALLLKAIFPKARLICLMEYFYRPEGFDMGFDPEFSRPGIEEQARLLGKNANLLLAMEAMDYGVSPTPFQTSTMPNWVKGKLRVIHEGVDTALCKPDAQAVIELPDRGVSVRAGDEVLTFVVRNLEPVRGYHIFMRALPEIMARRPNLKVFIVGGDGVSYGSRPESGSYRARYLSEVAACLDPKRVFFLGKVPHNIFVRLMQVTRCHVYLTYPFVLGWSVLEAMSCGALVVGSRTAPVTDVIKDHDNGLLVDFFDTEGLAAKVCEVLENPKAFESLRRRARETVLERFDLETVSLPAYAQLLDDASAL